MGFGVSKEREGERCCSVSHKDRSVNPNSLIFILEDVYCTRLALLGFDLFRGVHYSMPASKNCFLEADIFSQPPPKIDDFWMRLT